MGRWGGTFSLFRCFFGGVGGEGVGILRGTCQCSEPAGAGPAPECERSFEQASRAQPLKGS